MFLGEIMEKSIDLGFCNFIYSSDDTDFETEKNILIKAYHLNKDFAKIEIPHFDIKLVYSRQEFNKLWGSETPAHISAFTKNDNIVIFSSGAFKKETSWKEQGKFEEGLIHEINHLFYQELRDDEYDPLWLSEGLATFMQHGKKRFEYKDKMILTEEKIVANFETITMESYQVFTMFTEYLILKFGEDKILELIKRLKNGEELNNIFQKIYKETLEKLIKNGNEYHQAA